ncbi:spirocyclase AveC family protein [Nocardia higoensis]|uniref:spirocyclase AveC family protein n=1 Tax=Nocardia higoensis TaxID=228599 RepID=UPI0002FC02F8|nr:spirocyclase AveC family protein [Nocardia higoensis]
MTKAHDEATSNDVIGAPPEADPPVAENSPTTTPAEGSRAQDSPPIVWLARVGALIVALQLYIYIRWILSDDFAPVPHGPDEIPTSTMVLIRISEVICVVGMVAFVIWLVRRTRREGQLPTIGVFLIAWLLAAWQDVGVNAIRPVFAYSTGFFQMGSWGPYVPGWVAKGAETPQPIWYTLADYLLFLPLAVVGIDKVIKAARKRFPRLNKAGIVASMLLLFFVLDTAIEQMLQRQGLWTYMRVNSTWSIFPGTLDQFPLYEGIVFGAVVTVLSISIYCFRREDGLLISDAGIERLRSKRGVSVVRILALTTVVNAIMLVFNLGFNLVNQHADTTPPSIPSYFHVEMCGVADNPACPPPKG